MGVILRCADVHGRCEYIAHGKTDEEVLREIEKHIFNFHGVFGITDIINEEFRKFIHEEIRELEETT